MRSYGARALFVLAIVTECFGAHSDRSRQRSGPIRSVPVAADIKRDVDFDCPEEFGYYPHPSDCTLYYVCVFGGALLESCTGGLMYSHELQTCDWPRNVGCDSVSALGGEEIERISEREPPPPPPPRRTPPPPPPQPRAQPNPVVTSRGQPKFNREEYEKQQQLYAEVDDLPPVEEIESDRQQRVYRGQPSTIGQVQKDRDGYAQVNAGGRNLNSNIIPASISQNNGKIGSFSFGTQVDERRTATITQAPQTYSGKSDNMTDPFYNRQLDIITNEIADVIEKPIIRRKRDTTAQDLGVGDTNSTDVDTISARSGNDQEMEYFEYDTETVPVYGDEREQDDSERGKRQVRYYLKNGYKIPGKNWGVPKAINLVDLRQLNYNPQNTRLHASYNGLIDNVHNISPKPYSSNNNLGQSPNSYQIYQIDDTQPQIPFKPSLPDPTNQKLAQNSGNIATQIITKSPPISALKNNDNPFASLAGGFFNNAPKQNKDQKNNQFTSQLHSFLNRPSQHVAFPDSSILPSTVVTGKPILMSSTQGTPTKYRPKPNVNGNQNNKPSNNEDDYDNVSGSNEDESSENGSSEKDEDHFKHDFPDPPYEFTHPSHKFADIENPFANPNFDFDAFLAKLSGGQYAVITTPKPRKVQSSGLKTINSPVEVTTSSSSNSGYRSSTLSYKGMSTPRPFSGAAELGITARPNENDYTPSSTKQSIQQWTPRSPYKQQASGQEQQSSLNPNIFRSPQENAGIPLEAVRPKLKPPNFKDERQLPINFSFNRPSGSTIKPNYDASKQKGENYQVFSVTQKPYVVVTGTGSPLYLSTPKQQYLVKPEKIVLHPHIGSTGKPYLVSSGKPHHAYIAFKSTPKPLTTIANEQLAALQHYWNNNPSSESYFAINSTPRPNSVSEPPKLENLFLQTARPSPGPVRGQTIYANIAKDPVTTTTKQPPKRRPIPKPSPEMNDYYYEDDEEEEQYYYEPPVKSKYMPSSEVRPQRPPMAQNYKEYDDSSEEQDGRRPVNSRPSEHSPRRPEQYSYRPESVTKNYNDVSVVTKGPVKNYNKNANGKIPIPVLVNYATPTPTVLIRPEVSNYEILHHAPRNRTVHIRKPSHLENGPYTQKPPKYLNQTTLRPYTVRHRLAKPTTVSEPISANDDSKQTRGRIRHQNIVAHIKNTTPRDNHNQETRYTKTKHDDKTNSLEPTESVAPVSYSASPRPKMLYNGTQNYSPDQYDPFYAVYDEDGELYKDTDYVQQYNTASLRPAVQQTYRGTPPPARRPETYSSRPVADDYDDALIQGQISNQNQYQSPVRHSTRGEGNELGYEHIPSSVRTTIYEATSISTTPSTTTSTSTTTQRSTTAHFTEAMTPSRYTTRSPTDENPKESPEPSPTQNPTDGSNSSILTTPSPIINLSSLAKPFERTDNTHRLSETILSTETTPTSRHSSRVTNNNKDSVEVVQPSSNENKKRLSLTTGFSIRRNLNNTNNPYTLTVLSRPLDDYSKSRRRTKVSENINNRESQAHRYYYESENNKEPHDSRAALDLSEYRTSSESITPRKDSSPEVIDEEVPIYTRPTIYITSRPNYIRTTEPTTTSTATTKYYLKTVLRRPAPFSTNNAQIVDSTENSINTEAIIDTALENSRNTGLPVAQPTNSLDKEESPSINDRSDEVWDEPVVSPYSALNNLRKSYNNEDNFIPESTSTTTSTTRVTIPPTRHTEKPRSKPSYFSYRVLDEIVPDQTTEVFSGTVKNVIKAFFNNLVSSPAPRLLDEYSITTPRTTPQPEEKTVNIGFQKKTLKYVNDKPTRNPVKRIQIITEPSVSRYVPLNDDTASFRAKTYRNDFPSTSTTTSTTPAPIVVTEPPTTPKMLESSTNNEYRNILSSRFFESDYNSFVPSEPEPSTQKSRKFQKLLDESPTEPITPDNISYKNSDDETDKVSNEDTKAPSEIEWDRPTNKLVSEIASTTSTTKATSTTRVEPTTSTKSLSFPTRASRVNPAIKLAATNPGGGRRSYQTPSKCSSDNSLQANPKCNEIKYQRPSSTRGRGHAHYSAAPDAPAQIPNRGTPPTRSRPTLKPSTAIVSKSTESVDIYTHPPSRPAPVYPQPTPDKTAAKCRKDVCLLPDCYCGGRDIPGDLPVETVPQIVLLTFDDSVNDLNKGLYMDLFEKGRVNPNGCPITATFYVSHEWTDYSQVQNLYSAGHEMASHTVSHSFGEQFSQKKWNREVGGQREILAAYGGVKLEDVRGMRAPFLSVGGNKMFKMLYDSNFTYDSSMPVYENRPPSWPYTLDYKLFHDCMIPPCPTKSYPGVWEVPMVMWQDLNGGRCSMGDACANPPDAEGVYKMILKNFDRHYTTNRAPFGLYYHAAWFTQPHHKQGFIMFLDFINQMQDVWIVTNWQALQWVRDPTPISRINNFQPFQCNYQDRPKKCNNPKVCNLWHKSGVRYMRTCQPCPEVYPWTGKTGIRSSRIDNDISE